MILPNKVVVIWVFGRHSYQAPGKMKRNESQDEISQVKGWKRSYSITEYWVGLSKR